MIWRTLCTLTTVSLLTLACSSASASSEPAKAASKGETATAGTCKGFGPQTPRDIDDRHGENPIVFSFAPSYEKMNLCNIHFHKYAEHRSEAFSIPAGEGTSRGFACAIRDTLTPEELKAPKREICSGLKSGDTIEVHWVYSACDVAPGKGLGSCLADSCANPALRVEAQVFTLVNDPDALDITSFRYRGAKTGNYHQAVALPTGTGTPVTFLGSTTGPSYSEAKCSPLQVSWSVRPDCAKLDINSLGGWCGDNPFGEDHAHGVRPLVTNPKLLAPIE